MRNHRLQPGKLLDENGGLLQAGYSTSLIRDYRRKDIKAGSLRIKEWDYYLIYNQDFGIALTLADNAYMGLVGVSVLDFHNKTEKTTNIMTVMPCGTFHMPESSKNGISRFKNRRTEILFDTKGRVRHLIVKMKRFNKRQDFFADIILEELPDNESMVIVTPFQEKRTHFYYNQKIVGMKASGCAMVGDTTYSFGKNSFGLLDWGRGVWTYKNTWYWGAAQGLINDKVFGFNIGYGFGDTRRASENMIFYDGKAHKIDDIIFHIPKDSNGKEDYLKEWKFTTSDHRLDMSFQPFLDRKNCTNVGLICSDQHQVFGRFSGTAVLDNGEKLELTNLLGFAEKVYNKW